MSIYDDRMRSWERPWDADARWSAPIDYDEGVIRNQSLGDVIVEKVWIGVFVVLLFGEWAVRKVCRYR